jgi:hypothetical protein
MPLRFQRRFSLFRGLRANLSKSGVSFSLGKRGSWLNFGGRRRPSVTLGVPGTGLRYTTPLGNHGGHAPRDPTAAVAPSAAPSPLARIVRAVIWLALLAIGIATFLISRRLR